VIISPIKSPIISLTINQFSNLFSSLTINHINPITIVEDIALTERLINRTGTGNAYRHA
jgi:hypothetical protein